MTDPTNSSSTAIALFLIKLFMLRFCYVLLIVESKRKVSFSQDSGVQSHVRPQIKISPIDEQFISQIVLTPTPLEQPLANVLRSVFTAGRAETFQDTLAAWSAKKEEEIEAVCGEGYGLFVPTVETVLGRIRETGNLLDEKVTHLREELSSSAQHIYDTRVERFEARKMQLNVGKAVHSIEDSLKALNLLLSIQLEISDGHDHSAVKLIDELQGKGALRAIEEMPFYGKVLKSLEQSKKKVWESATGQVKRWLSSVRDESSVMGGLALSQLQTRFEQFQRHSDNTRPFELFLSELAAEDSEIITSNDLVKVDFSPLQGSLRLFTMMDKRGELIELLIETRRVQLDLILSSRVCLEKPDTDPKSLRSFLNALTGFFIFERLLTRLPLSIYPLGHLESRWEAAQNKIREIALDSLRLSSSDRAAFMKIKWQLVFFTHALEMFGYPKNQLVDTILTLFYRYVDLLRQDSIEKCQSAIKKDTFTETATHPTGLDLEYPENALIDCVQVIQINFLSSFSIFLEGVPGCSNRTIDFSDLARRTVDDQILPAAGKELFAKIQAIVSENDVKSSMISTQLVQILKCIHDFEIITSDGGAVTRLLLSYNSNSKANNTSTPTGPCHKLNSNEVFHNLLKKSYSSAVNLIDEDLDRILQKLRYDRNPKSSPSPAIQELLVLLNTLAGASGQLDVDLFWSPLLEFIVNFFDTKILSDVKYPHLSELFFKNLSVDLTALDQFFRAAQSQAQNNDSNSNSLAALLEMCSLLQAESVHEYLDPLVRSRKYSHVKTERIVSVLGKLTEPAEKRQSVEDLILLLK